MFFKDTSQIYLSPSPHYVLKKFEKSWSSVLVLCNAVFCLCYKLIQAAKMEMIVASCSYFFHKIASSLWQRWYGLSFMELHNASYFRWFGRKEMQGSFPAFQITDIWKSLAVLDISYKLVMAKNSFLEKHIKQVTPLIESAYCWSSKLN